MEKIGEDDEPKHDLESHDGRTAPSMRTLFPLMHRLLLVCGLMWSVTSFNADLFMAFIRTLISCGETDHCLQHPDDCIARDVHDPRWSRVCSLPLPRTRPTLRSPLRL